MRTVRAGMMAAVLSALGLVSVMSGGCQSTHAMRADAENKTTVCRTCYTKAVEVWQSSNGGGGGRLWEYTPTKRVYQEHQCPECKTTMVVHNENGTWTIKCPRCAPEGVACDKCQPPEGVAK